MGAVFRDHECLVTGGTGFIGRFVVRCLLQRGARVHVFCRSPQKARRLFDNQVAIVAGDLLDRAGVRDACRGIRMVIHLGGAYRFGRRDRELMLATNVQGTENVMHAAWKQQVERIVHVSSSGILENPRAPITERDFPAHVSRHQPYRRSKWLAEQAALAWAARGLPVAIASPSSPVGAEDETPTPTGRVILDYLCGGFPFAARTAMNFVDVTELADGILAVAERGRTGERYTLGHHHLRLDEFLRVLEHCASIPAPRLNLPWPIIAAAGSVGELLGGTRVCWETARYARRRQSFDLRKSAEELGWQPTRPIEASAHEAIGWFRNATAHEKKLSGLTIPASS